MERYDNRYTLGLDVGIASVGWSLIELDENNSSKRIIDLGVRIFEPGEDKSGESYNRNRREKRGIRRLIRRKRHRLDRTVELLDEYNIIDIDKTFENFNEYTEYSKKIVSKIIENYYRNNSTTPYYLKAKGLDEKLSNEELLIVLLHYAKHRGYKSNRQDNDERKSSEAGLVKSAIKENEELLKKYRSISEMFIKDEKFKNKIRNTTDSYKMCVTREMVRQEILMLLENQVKLNVLPHEFIEKYIGIWSSQRLFSEGPGYPSKYGGDLINKMIGTCKFTGEKRAPQKAPSVEKFIVLQSLANLRYTLNESEGYQPLSTEQKQKIIETLENQDSVTYKKIATLIDNDYTKVKFKGLISSRNDFVSALKKYKELKRIDKNTEIDIYGLPEEELKIFNDIKTDILYSKVFAKMPTYSYFRKEIKKAFDSDEWGKQKNNYPLFDEIIRILTNYKDEEKILTKLKENTIIPVEYYDFILNMPNFTGHIKISLSLVNELIPLLFEGYRYDEAMAKLGFNHSAQFNEVYKYNLLPGVLVNKDLNNQRVIRSLSQARKIINSIIKRYGKPYQINIEVARELAKSLQERKKIEKEQLENRENNEKIKKEIWTNFSDYFKSMDDIKSEHILKYKLWKEQDEICPYSLEKIKVTELFDNNLVQIDHILPYSRTNNDNYLNKTLVKTFANQNKGNRTPYEWLHGTEKYKEFEKFVLNSNKIPYDKKINYLFKNLTPEREKEFKEQNLNDTKNIARYLSGFIKQYLDVKNVLMVKGGITAKLRSRWGLNGLIYSYQSPTYRIVDVNSTDDEDVSETKNRDNHLHHALDATIVAVTNMSLINRISRYEKYKRYIRDYKLGKKVDFEGLNKKIIYYEKETGEILDKKELENFIEEATREKFLIQDKNNIKILFPVPYEEFRQELIIRLYEMNINKLRTELKLLNNYNGVNINNIYPVIPTFAKNKISGALHAETYYGIKEINDEKYLTERIAVISPRFTVKTIENIVDSDAGAKEVKSVLLKWINGYSNGEEAYKAKKEYPLNNKSGNIIKKVKVINRKFNNKGHMLSNKKVVDIDIIHKIGIYKKENDDNLYFVGYDLLTLTKIKNGKTEDLSLTVWWAQGNNYETLLYDEFNKKYTNYVELVKNDLIIIELKNGSKGLCLANGFSSGLFEVKSIYGDGYDLVHSKLFNKIRTRFQLTISTIKSIKKVHVDLLGKIEKQYY